jgi:hypothetical protein
LKHQSLIKETTSIVVCMGTSTRCLHCSGIVVVDANARLARVDDGHSTGPDGPVATSWRAYGLIIIINKKAD